MSQVCVWFLRGLCSGNNSDGAQFLWKIHFCPNLDKKSPKIGYLHFLKMLSFDFPKNNAK